MPPDTASSPGKAALSPRDLPIGPTADRHGAVDETPAAIALPLGEHGVEIPLRSKPAYFNYFWLRDACPSTIDSVTRERQFDITALPEAPRPERVWLERDRLSIDWQGQAHRSVLPLTLLETVFDNDGRVPDPADLHRRPWHANGYTAFLRIAQADVEASDERRCRLARAVIEDGVAIVTDMEDSDAALTRLARRLGPITSTVDGDYFDVRLTINPANTAYTARALELHTDLPSEEAAPGVQFLHCRVNTVEGGSSLFVDGTAVAEALRTERPDDFRLLSSYEIPFYRRQDDWDYRAHQRVIEVDHTGQVSGVTVSQHLQDTLDLPQAVLDDYYPALWRFLRLLQEPRFVSRFRLAAGECIVFDNHRVAHGREAFVAESGSRHLRGCYVDRGALRSTYRTLLRRLGSIDQR